MEVVLWRNKDVLLNVELFHARTWAFAFPKLLTLAFILYSVAASLPKMPLQSFPRHLVRFPLFHGGEWKTCMFDVFTTGFSDERI